MADVIDELFIFHDRNLVGSLKQCTLHPDPRADAEEAGFAKGTWAGFPGTPYADQATWGETTFLLGENMSGDLYRECRIYATHTEGETVTFWYKYCQRRQPKG